MQSNIFYNVELLTHGTEQTYNLIFIYVVKVSLLLHKK